MSLYKSIMQTSSMDNELIVGLDYDDPLLKRYDEIARFSNVKIETKERSSNLHDRINSLESLVDGRYIFVMNDDCVLVNKGWDLKAYDILKNFGSVVYGRTYDNSVDKVNRNYASFPIVSKMAVIKLGFIMDNTFGNHGSDVMTYRIYEHAEKVVDLKCVEIDHIYHNSQYALHRRMHDKTAVEMIERTFENNFNIERIFTEDITEKAKRLI